MTSGFFCSGGATHGRDDAGIISGCGGELGSFEAFGNQPLK
jgi:hypothetical protein